MPEMTSGPNVSWLDEELRRARGTVDGVRDVVDKQQVRLADQEQRIMALEDRLAKLQAELTKLPEAQEATQRTRDEIVLRISELRQDVQKRETESLRTRQIEREQDTRAIQEVRDELERITPLEQALAVRQVVEQKLNEAVMRLQQDLEHNDKLFGQIDDWRRQLQEGLSKLVIEQRQAGGELDELRQAQQSVRGTLVSLSTNTTKLDQRISELADMRQELTNQQNELLERERLADRGRAQTLAEWGRKLDGFSHELETWSNQMRFYADQYEKNRQTLRDIQTLAQEISQQQDRLRQLQRLSEEQMRRELREWQNENQRKWAQEAERVERAATHQGETDGAQDKRLEELEKHHEDAVARFGRNEEDTKQLRLDLGKTQDLIATVQRSVWRALQKLSQGFLAELHDTFGLED